MKATFAGRDAGLIEAVKYVNETLNQDETFWKGIREKPQFDFATIPSGEVERRVRAIDSTIIVKLWKPDWWQAWRYTNTVAVTDARLPRTLLYHTRFLGNDVGSKVNTIVHEFVHNVDAFDDGSADEQMGHGDNDPTGKQDSAPYWIGNWAEKLYRQMKGLAVDEGWRPSAYRHKRASVRDNQIVD